MIRVAFFYATFPRPTETFVRRELKTLQEIGFEPVVYSIWKGNAEWNGRKISRFSLLNLITLIYWIPYWGWKNPHVFKKVLVELWNSSCPNLQNWNETFLALGFALVKAKEIKSKNFDLLHGVWATMPATAVFAISQLTKTPFSMGAHAYDVFRKGGDWLLELKFRHALFIRTSSLSTLNRIDELGVSAEKIKLIRRGLYEWPKRENFKLVNNSHLEIISVGRLVEKKGYIYQLEIVKELLARGVPYQLKIIGDGPLKKELKLECNRLGLQKNVHFLGGLSQKEIGELYINSDLFLFTGVVAKNGDRDGIPNVIPEAMSSGCLVVASKFAGASEAFIEDVSGFSICPFETESWVDLIEQFWNSPESFESIRKSGVKHSKEVFDVKKTANSIVSLIQKKLGCL